MSKVNSMDSLTMRDVNTNSDKMLSNQHQRIATSTESKTHSIESEKGLPQDMPSLPHDTNEHNQFDRIEGLQLWRRALIWTR